MSDKYLVWHCCGVDVEDSKEAAFSHYHGMKDSDRHWPESVEGPGGVDLTEEAERYSDEADQQYDELRKQSPKAVGKIELREKNTDVWATAEWIYEGNRYAKNAQGKWGYHGEPYGTYKDRLLAEYAAAFGADRVRFTTT